MMDDKNNEEELFSDDPEEQMRIENEILKLKLKAELNGDFEGSEDLTADVENAFLKNVIAFEKEFEKAPKNTVFEILGKPNFPAAADLNDDELGEEMTKLEKLLISKSIAVDFIGEYPQRLKYQFITEELFEEESYFVNIPGMVSHFTYEEFHPNHPLDITNRIQDFYQNWLNRHIPQGELHLADHISLTDGRRYSKKEFIDEVTLLFESFTEFTSVNFSIDLVDFNLETDPAIGEAKGRVAYEARLDTGEQIQIEGPFEFKLEGPEYWQISFAKWPGLAL